MDETKSLTSELLEYIESLKRENENFYERISSSKSIEHTSFLIGERAIKESCANKLHEIISKYI